jgi:hypothetical protein
VLLPARLVTACTPPLQVPATDWEALKSPLMGLFEKRRAAKFFSYCQQYDERNPQARTPPSRAPLQAAQAAGPAAPHAVYESLHPAATLRDPLGAVPPCACRPGATGTCPA